jgi:hypothetical protein
LRTTFKAASALTIGACAALIIPSATGVASTASGPSRLGDRIGTPMFKVQHPAASVSQALSKAGTATIPTWSSSFTDPTNGQTYDYTMVGTDPHAGGAITTTIPTTIIPMKFRFEASADPNLHVLDGSDKVAQTIGSPVFQAADIGAAANRTASAAPAPPISDPNRTVREPHDVTQLGDAIYRAQFHKSHSGYHVLLGQPSVQPKASFFVPATEGRIQIGARSQSRIGLINYRWFTQQLKSVMKERHISPKVLPIFLVNNSFLYIHNTANCCVLGYHGAAVHKTQINTFMFASYSDPGIFAANDGDKQSYIQDIHGLSHEVQEWYDDPFTNNFVNPWLTPTAPQYGCTGILETGDPVVGYGFKVSMPNGTVYHPEDEVHFSWFARQDPSIAERGYYTYLNNFADPANGCA